MQTPTMRVKLLSLGSLRLDSLINIKLCCVGLDFIEIVEL